MISMKQARLILSNGNVRYRQVLPNTGSRIHIHCMPGDAQNAEHLRRIDAAFKRVNMTALRTAPIPKLAAFAGEWLTYTVLTGTRN